MSDPSIATELAIRSAARDPLWLSNSQPNTGTSTWTLPPQTDADGVDLDDSPRAHLRVQLRKTNVHQRSARYTIPTLGTGSGTHTVGIDGHAITSASAGYATVDAALVALKAAIDADTTKGQGASSPVVDSELLDSSGDVTSGTSAGGTAAVELRIYSHVAGAADYAVTALSTTMTGGAVAVDADPVSGVLYVFGSAVTSSTTNSPSGPTWCLRPDYDALAVDRFGWHKVLCAGGFQKGHAWLTDLDGPGGTYADDSSVTYTGGPTVRWGPAALE